MAATINGVAVNFGFQGTAGADGSQGISITGITGVLLQNFDQTKAAELERVRDGNGNDVVHAWSNIHDEATLEWVLAGASLAETLTGVSLSIKSPGSIVAITACTSMPGLVSSYWEVQAGAKISGSNADAKKVSMPIHLLPGITAAAS